MMHHSIPNDNILIFFITALFDTVITNYNNLFDNTNVINFLFIKHSLKKQ